ncbi:MAG: hypothetical protein QOI19_137, partial [Thermoleophilaceae bacterium]|nr:hypothetical protein [Thermoleophilaceae bacterium]
MRGIDVLRVVRAAVVAAGFIAALPSAALATPVPGGLQQLPPPNDCVSSTAASNCGSNVGGGLGQARSVAVTPSGASVYVASPAGSLSTFTRNGQTGALSFSTCVKDPGSSEICQTTATRPLSAPAWVVATNAFVYVATGNSITDFSRDTATGQLTDLGCIGQTSANPNGGSPCQVAPGLSGVSRLALSPDGNNLYAVSPSDKTVVVLNKAGNGTLSSGSCLRGTTSSEATCAPTPGLNGANSVDVAPDGNTVYVTATAGGSSNVSYITGYTRA